jgi:nitroreductase
VEFQDVVRRRRMVRKFTPDPVPAESLGRILHNATRGPSAGFSQGQAFLVLEGSELADFWTVGAAWVHESARTAPLVIVPLSSKRVYLDRYAEDDKGWTDRDEAHWPVPYWHIDTGMAALLILQTVVDEGLGAVFFGFDPDLVTEFRQAFGVPEDHEPIGAIAIGYSDEPKPTHTSAITRRRKSLDDVVHRGRW